MSRRALALCVTTLVAVGAAGAHAQPQPPDGQLRAAADALLDADFARARDLAAPLTVAAGVAPAARAEAERVFGLAAYALGQRADAEAALLEYLRLVPDAHLDPALYPPELVLFLEDVRTRHAGELLTVKPRPRKRKNLFVNLFPPAGQIQNGDSGRAWFFGGAELVFLGANVATYLMLRSGCANDLTCTDPDRARTLRTLNLVSAGLLAATWAAGTIDAFIGYPQPGADEARPSVILFPTEGGGGAAVAGRF